SGEPPRGRSVLAGARASGEPPRGRSVPAASSQARALLAALAAGTATAGVGLAADGVKGTPVPDGGLRATGTATLVLGAGDASHLVLGAATDSGPLWFLVEASQPGVTLTPRLPVDFSRALADVELADAAVDSDLVIGGAGDRLVPDLAATLAAAQAAGIATLCSQNAAQHARTQPPFRHTHVALLGTQHPQSAHISPRALTTTARPN